MRATQCGKTAKKLLVPRKVCVEEGLKNVVEPADAAQPQRVGFASVTG